MKQRPTKTYSAAMNAAPYNTTQAVAGPLPASSVVASQGSRYFTVKNCSTFAMREKPLPPDAHVPDAYRGARLFQLQDPVCFRCAKCRRDGIQSDCVVVDAAQGTLLCARCFSRIIRPRHFKPTRVVPFPSLVSWLTYRPPSAAHAQPLDNIMARPAEAVLPSGHRVDRQQSAPAGVAALPKTPMNPLGAQLEGAAREVLGDGGSAELHPCIRVWGCCQHGAVCFFRQAPRSLCIEYLMGLCTSADTCGRTHENVFDLPKKGDGALPANGDQIAAWVEKKKKSSNQAEWQLWNNGPVDSLIAQNAHRSSVGDIDDSSAPATACAAPLLPDVSSIRAALATLKKSS